MNIPYISCVYSIYLTINIYKGPPASNYVGYCNSEQKPREPNAAGQGMLYEYGQEALDRIAKAIGGKVLMTVLSPIIQSWSTDADWKKRQAVLIAISQVAEGCRKVMLEDAMLASIMALCCAATGDSHSHVKWAACQAIGQVCTDLALKVQKKHHGDIMRSLIKLMAANEVCTPCHQGVNFRHLIGLDT